MLTLTDTKSLYILLKGSVMLRREYSIKFIAGFPPRAVLRGVLSFQTASSPIWPAIISSGTFCNQRQLHPSSQGLSLLQNLISVLNTELFQGAHKSYTIPNITRFNVKYIMGKLSGI